MSKARSADRPVRLQLLLRPEWRTDAGRAKVSEVLESLQLQPSGQGAATLSARGTAATIAKVFGAGDTAEAALPVPPALEAFVQRIDVAPQHIYISEKQKRPKDDGDST